MASSESGKPFRRGQVIKVPFPYTDRATRQRRPALVVSAGKLQEDHGLLWVVMITSAENRGWPGDVEIDDPGTAGLPAPSVIRPAKIATIESRDAESLGCIDRALLARVLQRIKVILGQTVRK